MELVPLVKDLFYLETNDQYPLSDFDEIYFMMRNLIVYDIEAPNIRGLSERLPYALNLIATEKLSRQDVYTFFPIVWQKYEAYVKKILYITNPVEYSELASDYRKTLTDYLAKLNVFYKVPKSEQTKFTGIMRHSVLLRNSEGHGCEFWSLAKCYDELSKSLLSYLLITKHCMNSLKEAIKAGNQHTQLSLFPGSRMSITCPSFFALILYLRYFPGTDFTGIKTIEQGSTKDKDYFCDTFNQDGFLVRRTHISNDPTKLFRTTYDYKIEKTSPTTFTILITYNSEDGHFNSTTQQMEYIPHHKENEIPYTYTINYRGEIISFRHYRENSRTKELEPDREYEIEYLTDGSANILRYNYVSKRRQIDSGFERYTEKELYQTEHFNPLGLITSIDEYRHKRALSSTFFYNSANQLERIEFSDQGSIIIETINNDVFFSKCDEGSVECQLYQKASFSDGKLKEITTYRTDKNTGEEIQSHTYFTYYN